MRIPAGITHLTFDCYGTLIDWESGILAALEPLLARCRGAGPIAPETVLQRFVVHEAQFEARPWRPYAQVLNGVLEAMAVDFNWELRAGENRLLAESLPSWPPFSDTVEALRRLKGRYKLVIVSNTDDALFAGTARRLEVAFDDVITAEQVRGYKPGAAHFHEALRRMSIPVEQVLHVAQSLYHDHVPAKGLGWRTAWVRRPSRLPVTGLAPSADAIPDLVTTSLAELAE